MDTPQGNTNIVSWTGNNRPIMEQIREAQKLMEAIPKPEFDLVVATHPAYLRIVKGVEEITGTTLESLTGVPLYSYVSTDCFVKRITDEVAKGRRVFVATIDKDGNLVGQIVSATPLPVRAQC